MHTQVAGCDPMLIIFGGLPGIGKTTIARELASQLGAIYVRIDSIEQAIRDSGTVSQPIRVRRDRTIAPVELSVDIGSVLSVVLL